MSQVNIEGLAQLLSEYGWNSVKQGDHSIVSAFELEEWQLDLTIYLFEQLVHIEIPNLAQLPSTEQDVPLYDTLLANNGEMVGCKFCIDEDNMISLVLDLSAHELDFGTFSDALDLLTYYLEQYFGRIAELCVTS